MPPTIKNATAKNTSEETLNVFFTCTMDIDGHQERLRQATSLAPGEEMTITNGEFEEQDGLTITKQ